MARDHAIVADAAERAAGDQVHGRRSRSLMQIGPAFGLNRRQPDHRHHGHVAVQDHADIGRAAHGDPLHGRVHDDPLLDDRAIDLPAERIQAGENRRQVIIELAFADRCARWMFRNRFHCVGR